MDGVLADFGQAFHEVETRLFGAARSGAGEPAREEEVQETKARRSEDAEADRRSGTDARRNGLEDDESEKIPAPIEDARAATVALRRGATAARPRLAEHPGDSELLGHTEADRPGRRAPHPRNDAASPVGSLLHHPAAENRRRHGAAANPALARGAGFRSAERPRARRIARRGGRCFASRLPCRRQRAELPGRDFGFAREANPHRARRRRGFPDEARARWGSEPRDRLRSAWTSSNRPRKHTRTPAYCRG